MKTNEETIADCKSRRAWIEKILQGKIDQWGEKYSSVWTPADLALLAQIGVWNEQVIANCLKEREQVDEGSTASLDEVNTLISKMNQDQ